MIRVQNELQNIITAGSWYYKEYIVQDYKGQKGLPQVYHSCIDRMEVKHLP